MPKTTKKKKSPKSRRVIFRLAEEDYDKLVAQAEQVGLSVGLLARQRSLDSKSKPITQTYKRIDPALIKRLENIAHHLKRIGSNLNQLIKNSHIFKRISPKIGMLTENIEALCNQIESIISEEIDKEMDE